MASGAEVAGLTTRREFLRASAAAGAMLAAPSLVGCGSGSGTDRIVKVAIHPAIGIGRVGNSRDTFFFGPEVPGALPHSQGGFKDANGAVARQAARFRLFGLDKHGDVVSELAAGDADITWRVDVANSKAEWYEFSTAFDVPGAPPAAQRNDEIRGHGRERLVVAPPGRTIRGTGSGPVKLDGGSFLGEPVPLGELMTDGQGRLVVLPAQGKAYSPQSTPLGSFSDNPGWTDDVCDGPIRATVKLGDRVLQAEPAWLITTPPNYAPAMATGVTTVYDAARSSFVDAGTLKAGPVSFSDDILPLFARIVDLQWVSAGFFESNGFGSANDWLADGMPDRLADSSSGNTAFRRKIFESFRSPGFKKNQPHAVPELYGDEVGFPQTSPRFYFAITSLQDSKLRAWADGDFTDDRGSAKTPASLADIPLAQQPAALDRAALDSCLGGAFHPGIEAPWTLRETSLWERPYRLRVRNTRFELSDYGKELDKHEVFKPHGPLDGVSPGDLTRWLGTPWHADGASCRSGYQRAFSTVLPTFWPARIPTQVLSEENYKIVMDRSRPLSERQKAFRTRDDWERFIAKRTRPPTLELMVSDWPKMGMVAERPGPGDPHFPKTFKVESLVGFDFEPKHQYGSDLWVPQVHVAGSPLP